MKITDTELAKFYKKNRKTIARIRLSDNKFDIATYKGLVKMYKDHEYDDL